MDYEAIFFNGRLLLYECLIHVKLYTYEDIQLLNY